MWKMGLLNGDLSFHMYSTCVNLLSQVQQETEEVNSVFARTGSSWQSDWWHCRIFSSWWSSW